MYVVRRPCESKVAPDPPAWSRPPACRTVPEPFCTVPDNHLAEDECTVARDAYATALSMAQELKLMDLVTVLDWKVYKADFCLGAAVLPLPGSGTEDATCGIPTLANELLLSDFDIAASRFGGVPAAFWLFSCFSFSS